MNKNRLFGILVLIFVLFSAMSIASASDNPDDGALSVAEIQNTLNLADESNEISISQDSFTQLNDKIQSISSGGTLTLDKNYTYSDGDIKTGIVINKDLTIDGRGYTLNGAGQSSIFKITGNHNVILKNINFINAYGQNGAALQLSADNNVEISNSKFINNIALANGGAISVEDSSTITASITISNSLFVNNKASTGGAISAKGTLLNVVDSKFNNNNASKDGGSIYLDVGAYVDRCSFINDYAAHDGGTFYLNGIIKDMTALPEALLKKYGIFNTQFISCGAGNDGGAGYIYGNHGVVDNVTVIGCTAGNRAGAGYIDGDRGMLTGSTFINNTATRDAGAIMWTGMNGMLVGCEFINNTATFGDGAALYLQPADNVSVFDGISIVNCSTFINNVANFNGGAIYASGIFVVIHNSQFMGDSARDGAGIYLDVGASIEYCTFIGEYAKQNGGAIYLSASNIEYADEDSIWMQILLDNIGVRHSTIVNCSADYDGGAGYVAGNYGIVSNVTMIGNTAGHDGGAGYILGSYGKLYNSTMINNRAARDGGALMWAGNHGLVDNVTCMLNSANGGSGSVCVDGLNITILKSRFMLSNATLSGGAIYVYGDDASIYDSLFDRCAATAYHGGAVYVSGKNAYIERCNFTMNRVNVGVGCGGAINVEGNDTHILNCNFDKCTAFEGGFVNIGGANVIIENVTGLHSFAAYGGAFYIEGDNATITNVDFENNNATQYAGAIYVEGDFAKLTNIKLVKNIAYNMDGGAIYVAGSNTTIINANLVQNRVVGPNARGGAVYLQGDYNKIFNSTFDMCTAYDGGVIYINGSYSLIDGYSCIRSLALNDGGAIYVAGDHASIADFNISLTNATNYGGAIYVAGDDLCIHNSNFTKCAAYNHNGGAIYVLGKNTTISKSDFVMNKVNTENGCGGSIGIHGNFTKILNCTFNRCTAYEGGVIYINGSYTVIDGYSCIMSFASNHGGAIYVEGDYATIADFNISRTNATNHGGAMFIQGDFASIHNSNFTMCTAYNRNGGAIYVLGKNTTISESSFTMNKVNTDDGCGGSIGIHGNFTKILNCTYMQCTAHDGGVLYVNGSSTVIDGFSCLMSFASNNGGAIYVEGDNAYIADFVISLTNATNYGGAMYVSGDNTTIHNSTFTKCIADNYDGGALYITGLNTTVSDSVFLQNKVNNVSGRGGSVDINGNYTSLINCDFEMCSAYEGGVVNIEGSYAYISGFSSNMSSATDKGGSLFIAGDYVTIDNFTIGFCNATNNGAAIYITGDDDVNILNGNLTTCIAVNGDGGAIYVGGYNTTVAGCNFDKTRALYGRGGAIFIEGDLASIEDSNFIRSFAADGGIIYISGHDADIINNNLTYSWSVDAGGAIYIEGHDVLIKDTNFGFINASNSANEYAGWGGALYIEGDNVNITNSTFFKCIAEKGGSGGAIFILGENVNIEYSNFTYCAAPDYFDNDGGASAAGAIAIGGDDATVYKCNFIYSNARNGGVMFVEGANTQIIDSNISRSFADYDGGAIYIYGENTNISGTSFDYVKSERHGGAVYIRFGEGTNIENSNFTLCNSTYGGAIDIDGSDVKIADSNLVYCFSAIDGGALYIAGDNVTIVDSNFTNCDAESGNAGAIYWIGSIGLVDNCNFTNNTAPRLGGAIYLRENSLITFQNSHFANNTAGINGGAIDFNRGAHDGAIINSTFENNLANRSGGAVFWFGTNGTIKNSTFTNNMALGIINYTDSYGNVTYGGYGGAIIWTGAQGLVDNCIFIGNEAKYNEATKSGGRGGAVYLQGSDVGHCINTTFSNSIFINNTAGYNGGAVDWYRGAENGRVENSTFINNTAHRSGGAIYWSGVNGTIKGSEFMNNTALGQITDANGGGDGGAVLWVGHQGNIIDSNFTDNTAAYSGGAMYLKGSDDGSDSQCDNVSVSGGVFENNFAGLNGGAIDWQKGAVNGKLSDATFINNTAMRNGGAVFWYGHNGTVSGCNFTDNEALGLVDEDARGVHIYIDENDKKILGGSGGAIAWTGDIGNIEESNFQNNTARRLGGAVYLRDNSDTQFKNSHFTNNTAGINGGAIDFNRGAQNGVIINSTFDNNHANRSAGAVFWFGTNGTIEDSTFINNSALGIANYTDSYGDNNYGGNGGAVVWTGTQGIVDNCTFIDNEAAKHGGAVYLQGSDIGDCYNTTFKDSTFISNIAGDNGGAVDWHEGAHFGNIYNTTFEDNVAKSNGGAVFWNGHNGEIYDSKFINNSALGLLVDRHGNIGDGGAIIWSGINGTVDNCSFIDNYAARRGGAVYLQNCTHGNCENTSFTNVYFQNNTAGTNGGAIDWHAGAHDGLLENGTFINNTAKRSGGAVYWNGEWGTINHSNFTGNRALGVANATDAFGVVTYGGDGGAVIWIGPHGSANDCIFEDNVAAKRGGAVYLQGTSEANCSDTNFTNSYFRNNSAGTNGGAIDWNKGAHNGLIDNVTFINNTAKRSGGAVYWNGEWGQINNATFTGNKALGVANATDAFGVVTYGGDGGAVIWIGPHGSANDCVFVDNEAAKRGGAVYLQGTSASNCTDTNFTNSYFKNNTAGTNGGAIDWNKGAHNGLIDNAIFINNTAKRSGGAVYWNGEWGQINNATFTGNKALGINNATDAFGEITYGGDGGAVIWIGPHGSANDCVFVDNVAAKRGGAVYLQGTSEANCSDTNFTNSYFENNSAGTNGGAIDWNKGAHNGLIDNATFINNTAKRSGGAVYWNGEDGGIKESTFIGNKALGVANATDAFGEITYGGDGGAVIWIGPHGYADDCVFVDNVAAKRGGAVYLQGTSEANCSDTNFTNSYFENNSAGTNGGAIDWNKGAYNGRVENATFINNAAKGGDGGAIYWYGDHGIINNATFINNSASQSSDPDLKPNTGFGGAVSCSGNDFIIDNATFANNSADLNGGAVVVKAEGSRNTTLQNSLFTSNEAGRNGGAICWNVQCPEGTIINCTFEYNRAHGSAGAAGMQSSDSRIYNSTFRYNEAIGDRFPDNPGNGGALVFRENNIYAYNCTFENNKANRFGGAAFVNPFEGNVAHKTGYVGCTFIDNVAGVNGGAISLRNTVETIIDDSEFINNTAKEGGAIYWVLASNETITNSKLIGNVANKGSAMYLVKSNFEIINTTFLDNKADAKELVLTVVRSNNNKTIEVVAQLKGNDNIINAIWNDGTSALTNVTYWGSSGVLNSGNSRIVPVITNGTPTVPGRIYQTQYEDYQNITFYIYDVKNRLLAQETVKTNISGMARFAYTNTEIDGNLYEYVFHKDDNYYGFIENSTSKHLVDIKIPTADIFYSENETFVIEVVARNQSAEVPTGNITIWFNDEILYENMSLSDGKSIEINLVDLPAGDYTVAVSYTGDEKCFPRENSTTFKVMKYPSFVILNVENYTYGEPGKITVQVHNKGHKIINVTLAGQTYQVKINESGYGEIDIPKLPHGTYTVSAVYPGNENYLEATNSTVFEIYPLYNTNLIKEVNITGNASMWDLINFTIIISNDGSVNLTDARVTDILPKYLEFVSAGSNSTYVSVKSIIDGKEVVTWDIGNFDVDNKLLLWVVVKATLDGTFTNNANVTSNELQNVSNDVEVNVTPAVDLTVNKTVDTTSALVRDEITYTITVFNRGPSIANDVNVTEKLSKLVELVKKDASYGNYDENSGVWYVGKLASGEKATLTLRVKLISQGIVENNVSVKSKEMELNEFDNSYVADNVTVVKSNTSMNVNDVDDIKYGEDAEITVILPNDATGHVDVTVNGKHYGNVSVEEGIAKLTLSGLSGGDYEVTIDYSGDDKYVANSTSVKFNVAPLTPTIKIEVVDIMYGEIEVLNVTVNAPGSVNITVDGITIEIPLDEGVKTTDVLATINSPNYNGKATWNLINLPMGVHKAFASYNGNENYTSVNTSDVFHVFGNVDHVEINVPDVSVGENAVISVEYPSDATGNVTVTVNGKTYTKELNGGKATFTVPKLKAGTYDVEVSYSGDDKYLPNESSTSFEVSKVNSKLESDNVDFDGEKLTVTLPKDAKGTVTIEVDGKKYTKPVKNGKVVFDLSDLKDGSYDILIFYSGDDKYDSSDLMGEITVYSGNGSDTNDSGKSHGGIDGDGIALDKYATANPIFVLLCLIFAIFGISTRRYKK